LTGCLDGETVLEIKCPLVVRNQMIHTKTVPFLKEEDTPCKTIFAEQHF
jgi:hypothetical protein